MPSVDISQVPSEQLYRLDLLSLKKDMESALSQKAWINAFCIHEAGHMTYFTQLGVIEYDFQGPRIAYDQEIDSFAGYMASVKPSHAPALPDTVEKFQCFISIATKAYVAGKVFTRSLTTAPDSGEEEDRQNFDDLCRTIEIQFSGLTLDRQQSWLQAEREVALDLRSPQFRTKAWETAKIIEKKVFVL